MCDKIAIVRHSFKEIEEQYLDSHTRGWSSHQIFNNVTIKTTKPNKKLFVLFLIPSQMTRKNKVQRNIVRIRCGHAWNALYVYVYREIGIKVFDVNSPFFSLPIRESHRLDVVLHREYQGVAVNNRVIKILFFCRGGKSRDLNYKLRPENMNH